MSVDPEFDAVQLFHFKQQVLERIVGLLLSSPPFADCARAGTYLQLLHMVQLNAGKECWVVDPEPAGANSHDVYKSPWC